jgi:amino-acid N-acetyltransferase
VPIAFAAAADLEPIRRLLEEQGLSGVDIDERSLNTFLVLRDHGQIVGIVGLDPLGPAAMLRSLVVHPHWRKSGRGGQLVAAAEALAVKLGVSALYLLTTDADHYFAAKGYRRLPRAEAPPAIGEHPQFRSLCPATAIFMSKAMNAEPVRVTEGGRP